MQEPMPADFYKQYKKSLNGAFLDPDKATDADLINVTNAGASMETCHLNPSSRKRASITTRLLRFASIPSTSAMG